MPKGKKASKAECKQAMGQLKQVKDPKKLQTALVQLIKAGCITEQQAQQFMEKMSGGGGGGGSAGGNPTDMDNATYEQSHGGQRA